MQFQDLGLLIVDEEQRFGVAHKERLKQLRQTVDVLTLTATPIPRTLHMSLSGHPRHERDRGPAGRPAARCAPTAWRRTTRVVREAILRELDRGGQIYYVHNRIDSIYREAERLQQPRARRRASGWATAR